jgi:Predicted ATPase
MLDKNHQLLIAKNDSTSIHILPKMLNRHGLVTGATGTGKTVSLQVIAESLSSLGVPCLITDIKGDVSGISKSGGGKKPEERVESMNLAAEGFQLQGCPVCFWDVFGKDGHPLRTTISDMGPLLISRTLDLNDTQSGVLQLLFRIADDNGLLLLDLKDLRMLTEFVSNNRADFTASYGNLATSTLGAIQRGLLGLEEQGGNIFFGEPALDIFDLLRRTEGKGIVNILAADKLVQAPRIYASMLLWMLSDLYEKLPETGDLDMPKLVLFFDEAHLVFSNAPKALLEKIEQVVRLIRSKAVGVFFITQNPADIPETVLAQLGNRIQHALRAYTPKEQKAVKAAASAFRPNPAFKTEDAITELGVGEALVSCLDEKGIPMTVERALMLPPQSQIGPITPDERQDLIKKSQLYGQYERVVDRESAYEILTKRVQDTQAAEAAAKVEKEHAKNKKDDEGIFGKIAADFAKKTQQSVSRNIANQVGRSLVRGILGSLFGGKK